MSKNIIELNGKRYDALTGALLGKARPHLTTRAVAPAPKKTGRVLDGFIRPTVASAPAASVAKPKATPVATPTKVSYAKSDITPAPKPAPKAKAKKAMPTKAQPAVAAHLHTPAKPLAAHQPEHARTLMRRGVHKPDFKLKPAIKPQAPAELAAAPPSKLATKRSVASVDPGRLARAQQAIKHAAVAKFSYRTPAITAAPIDYHVPATAVPVIAVHPAPTAVQPTHHQPPRRTDIFEAAIARATSHAQPSHRIARTRKRKLANAFGIVATFLVIAGFVAFLNLPNIQLHVASIQAGFKATMPNYAPVGYALSGGVRRSGNTVSMVYRSGENNYTVTQQPTNWDNQTLIDNTLALQSEHQTVQIGGRTVYVYNNNAVWVAGNVRYDVIGNAPLTKTDIQQLALSM